RRAVLVNLHEVGVLPERVAVAAPRMLDADLHAVRAGDVRRGSLKVVANRRLLVFAAASDDRDSVTGRPESRVAVRCAGKPRRRSPFLRDARLVEVLVPFDVAREAAFDEQLAADRR